MTNFGNFINAIGGSWDTMDKYIYGPTTVLWVESIIPGKTIDEIMYNYDLHRTYAEADVDYFTVYYEGDSNMGVSVSIDIDEGKIMFTKYNLNGK